MCAPEAMSLDDLASLPWFKRVDGRIQIADRSLGPSIDCHTHLSLAYLRPNQIDLSRLHPETLTYLPKERAFFLDRYLNASFTDEDLHRLKRDLVWGSLTAGGMRITHTAANLARDMDDLGIAHSLLLPIDFPFISDNAGCWREAVAGDPRFICYGSVHPYAPRRGDRIERQHALGARGIKMHPNVQVFAPEGRKAMGLYGMCRDLGMVVFWHSGPVGIEPLHGKILTQMWRYEKPIREFPACTFVLGHAGALQNEEALELARRYPNVYLEISGQSVERIRTMIERGPTDRMVFGTDWPWYHQAIGLAKVFLATEGNERVRRAILFDNAARLLGIVPTRSEVRHAN
jgi:predicted TIM-barrel fold metal-dependent hydrolase